MVSVPLGMQAYARRYAGEAEIRLVNRYMEAAPANLREKTALLSRPGSVSFSSLAGGLIRATFSKVGLFGGDLFTVSGPSLWRSSAVENMPVTGTIAGTGFVHQTWMKGIGYEFMFVSDGATLQYYSTRAMGTLTLAGGSITDWAAGGQVININGTYYGWSATVNPVTPPTGASGAPYLAKLGSAVPDGNGLAGDQSSLSEMAMLLNFSGVSGSDYSTTVPGANPDVAATGPTISTAVTSLVLTAIADLSSGNTITTSIFSGTHLAWGAATLTGGGNQTLQTVSGMGATEQPGAVAAVSGYVLVAVANSQKFYWINPGETLIDPLNFATKESSPDNISEMITVGDSIYVCGDESTESWYASGNFATPFLPVEGRMYRRGVLAGTPVAVKDELIVVGDDLIVYSIGYQYGATSQFGVHRISTHGIEERIRTQVRSLQGLAP